jgi:hypothetical protein
MTELGEAERRAQWRLLAMVVGLALIASVRSVSNGFALDDVPVIAQNPGVQSLSHWRSAFTESYWPPKYGATLYRPLVKLGYMVQWTIGGGAPVVFHVVSIIMYAAVCGLVFTLFASLMPVNAATIGAALFAVHPLHTEAVGNVVGQAELWVALTSLSALILYIRWRRTGDLSPRQIAIICALFALGCLAKEHGMMLPVLLAAAELLVGSQESGVGSQESGVGSRESGVGSRVRRLVPVAVAVSLTGAAFIAARSAVLGSLLGENQVVPMYGMTRVYTMLSLVPEWLRLFVWPAHLAADYSPPGWAVVTAPGPTIIPGIVLVIAYAGFTIAAILRARVLAFWLVWIAITMFPVSNLVTGIMIEERTMFLPSVAVTALLGQGAAVLLAKAGDVRWRKWLIGEVILALLMLGAWRSSDRMRIWRNSDTVFAQTVVDAPYSYRAHYLYGIQLFNQQRPADGEREMQLAIKLNPVRTDADPLNYLATQYRMAHMCPQALPLYQRAVRADPRRPDARFGLASCLLTTGDLVAARAATDTGLASGQLRAYFLTLRASVDSAQRAR